MGHRRIHPSVQVRIYTEHCYSPRGARPRLIILHDTEGHNVKGLADLKQLGGIFLSGEPPRSCHVATDAEGQSGRFVRDGDAAWQAVAYNRAGLGIEQIGFASQTSWPGAQLHETARWIAHWSRVHGIPIRRARTAGGVVLRSGVTTHAALGRAGGSHSDPGGHYPFHHVLELARDFRDLLDAAS